MREPPPVAVGVGTWATAAWMAAVGIGRGGDGSVGMVSGGSAGGVGGKWMQMRLCGREGEERRTAIGIRI
jgi:hypothetical protein